MRKRLMNSVLLEILLVHRSPFSWLIFLAGVGEISWIIYARIEQYDIGGALTATAAIVQGGIFAFMILGFTIIRSENVSSSDEVFQTINNASYLKLYAKVISILCLIGIYLAIVIVFEYAVFSIKEVPYIFYWKSFEYLLLYFAFPFFISGLIGILLGSFLNTRLVYGLLIFISVCIGPLNSMIFENIMAIFKVNMFPFFRAINLGQSDIHNPFDPVYGYPMEISRWLTKFILILLLMGAMQLRFTLKYNRNLDKKIWIPIPIYLIVSTLLFFVVIQKDQVLVTGNVEGSNQTQDKSYYQNKVIKIQKSNDFKIINYNT